MSRLGDSKTRVLLGTIMVALTLCGVIPVQKSIQIVTRVPRFEQEPYTARVPYVAQEAYVVQVPYVVQEPYSVVISYQETITVTKTALACGDSRNCNPYYFGWKSFDLREQHWVDGSWSSSDKLALVFVCSKQTRNSLIAAFISSGILAALGEIATFGTITPALVGAFVALISGIIGVVATSNDYSAINQQSGSFSKNWASDTYYVLVVNTLNKNVRFDLQIRYTYPTTETVTRYRTEVRYQEVTKYRDEMRYRDVTKDREEVRYSQVTRLVEETQQASRIEYPYLPLAFVGMLGLVAVGGWHYIATQEKGGRVPASRKTSSRAKGSLLRQ